VNAIDHLLAQRLAALPAVALWVGFSGGLDSTVLLHALAQVPEARARGLTALHVDHDSSALSAQWTAHCRATAARLGIGFATRHALIEQADALGLEAAWRRARRAVFSELLPSPGVLALAHHRDDQVETVLLRLLHGAGSEGLAGMRALRALRSGDSARWLWRPLLDVPRAALEAYARDHGLPFVDDPANADPRHARTRLRGAVLPALRGAFPDADARIADAAVRLRSESDALDAAARSLLEAALAGRDAGLACAPLRAAPAAVTRRAFGLWLDELGLPRPPSGAWARLRDDLLDARPDAAPALRWHGARVRRHGDRLHADSGSAEAAPEPVAWNGMTPLPWCGQPLCFAPPLQSPRAFVVRTRAGGETLRLRGQTRSVKKLLQEAGLPAWERTHLPLLFDVDGTLCAVGARWLSDAFAQWMQAQGVQLRHGSD
jgi:tRNA(Ile)-lysidine synthase